MRKSRFLLAFGPVRGMLAFVWNFKGNGWGLFPIKFIGNLCNHIVEHLADVCICRVPVSIGRCRGYVSSCWRGSWAGFQVGILCAL